MKISPVFLSVSCITFLQLNYQQAAKCSWLSWNIEEPHYWVSLQILESQSQQDPKFHLAICLVCTLFHFFRNRFQFSSNHLVLSKQTQFLHLRKTTRQNFLNSIYSKYPSTVISAFLFSVLKEETFLLL